MGKVKDLTGQRFERLVAQYYKLVPNPMTGKNDTYWHCKCDCGNEKDIRRGDLQQGKTVSCGCYNIPCCNICIEYDGIQHFDKNNLYYSEDNIRRDKEKDEYCKRNNIILVRIPYTDYSNISLEYILESIKGEKNE